MKEIAKLLFVVLALSSCNNEEPKKTPAALATADVENVLKNSITLFPDSSLLKENLIQYYRDKGNYDSAIAYTDLLLQGDSSNPRLWRIKGTLDFENEDTSGAIHAFEKAVGLRSDRANIISLGTLYAQTKNRLSLSLADTLIAHHAEGPDKEALFIKGLYFNYLGEKQNAIRLFDQCLGQDYTDMPAYREKAIALFDLKKYKEAMAVLDKATTLQNSFEEGYFWKGRCLEKLNRINEAIDFYNTALLYDPEYVEAKEALKRLEGN